MACLHKGSELENRVFSVIPKCRLSFVELCPQNFGSQLLFHQTTHFNLSGNFSHMFGGIICILTTRGVQFRDCLMKFWRSVFGLFCGFESKCNSLGVRAEALFNNRSLALNYGSRRSLTQTQLFSFRTKRFIPLEVAFRFIQFPHFFPFLMIAIQVRISLIYVRSCF